VTSVRSRLETAALWTVSLLAVLAGWTELVARNDLLQVSTGQAVFFTLGALGAPGLATAMLRRHPDESSGPLLGATMVASMLGACRVADLGPVAPIAGTTALVLVLLPAVFVVRYPALRCPAPVVRAITTCFWIAAVLGAATAAVLLASGSVPATVWHSLPPAQAPGVAITLLVGQAAVVVIAAAIIVGSYWLRDLPRNARRALRPMMLPTIGWCVSLTASTIWTVAGSVRPPRQLEVAADQSTTYVVLPAILVGTLAAGVGWIDLTVRTRSSAGSGGRWSGLATNVEQYLSRALADPSIRVLYPVDQAGWVDAAGRPAAPGLADDDRAATVIMRGQTVIGLIDQDAAITARPDAVELIATGAGLIMETERLMAAANRDLEQARLLAERLLSASDGPRAQLRAQLLAGPLAELDAVQAALIKGAAVAEVVPRLTAVAAQVRSISHGVFPLSLTTGGLRAALDCSVSTEHRYPPVVEMTAYLVVDGDPAATIDATPGADRPELRIHTGRPPSTDVRDRIAALGGEVCPAGSRWSILLPLGIGT
jgi:hypothetical protein